MKFVIGLILRIKCFSYLLTSSIKNLNSASVISINKKRYKSIGVPTGLSLGEYIRLSHYDQSMFEIRLVI